MRARVVGSMAGVVAMAAAVAGAPPALATAAPPWAPQAAVLVPAATDPVRAGFDSSDVEGGRVRAVLTYPLVDCPDDAEYGVSFLLSAFAADGDYAGGARLTITCYDGARSSELVLIGADSLYGREPDIHVGPGDPLELTIVDLGDVTEVRVHNLQNGNRDSFGYGHETLDAAEVGADRVYINDGYAPIPPFQGFDGFTDVHLGRARPATWTRTDLVDEEGAVELRTVRDGKRSFDLVLAP